VRQLHLSRDEFERLLKGELSRGEYVEILKRRGIVS
jgi:hypothetical protein